MAEPGIKYKFGDSELDLASYVHNLENNVGSYLEHRAKKAGWNEAQSQEFKNAYLRYIGVLKGLLAGNHTRLSTNGFGDISDTNNELNDTDLDNYYYNNKGEQIKGEDYDKMRSRKQKKYADFQANKEVARYWNLVGKGILAAVNKPAAAAAATKYDQNKHGFKAWWSTVKNPNGGTDLTPYLNLDPYDTTTGKRPVVERAKRAAGFIGDPDGYLAWLKKQNLDYSDSPLDFNERASRLTALKDSWGNGVWDNDDMIHAHQAGIDKDWLEGFFTEKENPLKSQAEIDAEKAKADAEAKTAEEKAKAELAEKDRRAWIDQHYNNYTANRGNYHDDNYGYNVGALENYDNFTGFAQSFKATNPLESKYFITRNGQQTLDTDRYINDWLANPWSIESKRALWYLINRGQAQPLQDGSYYIELADDELKGRVLLYDPHRGSLRYTFIGNVAPVWDELKRRRNDSINPESRYSRYGEGGTLPKYVTGGYFENTEWLANLLANEREGRGTKAGRTGTLQLAAERVIGKTPGSGEENALSQDNSWEAEDYARAVGAVGDIISGVSAFVPGYGTVVSAITGVGSTVSNFAADWMDDSVSFGDMLKNVAVNLGFDAAGLIPVGGNAVGTFGKILRNSGKVISKGAMILGTIGAFNNREEIMKSFSKFNNDPTHLDVADWQNIAQGLCVAFGITGAAGRKLTLHTYNADNGMPYNRKGQATVDQQSIAVEMVNKNTGAKEYRVFEGDTAAKIREAQANGDTAALRRETVEKFDELKDMDIATGFSSARIRGFHDSEGWHANPFATQEGTPRIYNIATGVDGKPFIQRGKWTGDIVTSDPKVKKAGKTNAEVAQEKIDAEDALIKNDPDVAAAIAGSQRVQGILDAQSTRVANLEAQLRARELKLTDYDATHPTRSTTLIQSDIDNINRNAGSYSERLSKYQRRAKIADELDASGNVVNKGKASLAIDNLVSKRVRILGEINAKTKALATATKKKEKAALLAELDSLIAERERLFKLQKHAETARTKAQTDSAVDKKWLEENDAAKLPALNAELTTAQGIEAGRQPFKSAIETMKARIDAWKAYNSGTKSDETIKLEGRKNADGTISFNLPGHTDPVVRNWNDIISKFAITHRRGGAILKFEDGGISNIKGNLDWYTDMYNSPEMKAFFSTNFTDADLLNFNNLLTSWRSNLTSTGYDPTKPDKAKGINNMGSTKVFARQTKWNALSNGSLNKVFERALTEGRLVGNGTGKGDSQPGGWRDGYFGTLEYLRHFGSKESWASRSPEELAAAVKFFKDKGLDYKLDEASGMYLLSRIADPANPTQPAKTPETDPILETDPTIREIGMTDIIGTPEPEQHTDEVRGQQSGFRLDPATRNLLTYAVPRNIIANAYNDKITKLAKDNENNVFLENPFENYKLVYSSLDDEQAGIRQKAELMRLASRPMTSDGALQLAVLLEAATKGLAAEAAGRVASNKMYRTNLELAEQARITSAQNIHKVAEANRESLVEAKIKKNLLEQIRLNKLHTNNDIVAQLAELNAKLKLQGEEQFARSDIHNNVYYHLKDYAPSLTDEQLAVWNKVLGGAQYTSLSELEQQDYLIAALLASDAELNEYRKYLGYAPSTWDGVRSVSTKAPSTISVDELAQALNDHGVSIQVKKKGGTVGEKIEVQKLRNKAKDIERFHKNAQKAQDRSEKALDRSSKYRRVRRT